MNDPLQELLKIAVNTQKSKDGSKVYFKEDVTSYFSKLISLLHFRMFVLSIFKNECL